MSDHMDDVLSSIDAALAKCICGQPIPADGVSLDYCSDVCQYRYTAERIGAEPASELLYELPPAETDGRAINAAVNRRFRPGVYTDDPFIGLMDDVSDRLREAARQAERHLRIPDTSHAATFQRAEVADPAAPTLAELDAGIDLTDQIARTVTVRMSIDTRQYREAVEQTAAALQGITVEQTAESLRRLGESLFPTEPTEPTEPPSTGEEFRRRALEARRTRNTGPEPRRQRLPRDHRR